MSKLIIRRGDEAEREVELGDHRLRLGRGPQNDVVLTDPTKAVSRVHAELRIEGGKYVLADLDSRNGLWVRGRRQATIPLEPGVPITIGTYTIVLQGPATPAEETRDLPLDSEAATTVAPTLRENVEALPYVPPYAARGAQAGSTARSGARAVVQPSPAARRRLPVPVLLGGVVVVLVAVLGILYVSSRQPVAPPSAVASGTVAPSNVEVVRQHIADARTQMDRKEYDAAIRDHLEPALGLDPGNAEALALKVQALDLAQKEAANQSAAAVPSTPEQQALPPEPRAPVTAETDRTPKPRASATPPAAPQSIQPATNDNLTRAAQPRVRRRPGEATADWYARDRDTAGRYDKAKTALEAGSFQAALATFTEIERADPDYPEVAALAARAREGMRAAAQGALDAGQKAEAVGDLLTALQQYQRAVDIDPSVRAAVDESSRRVHGRMKAEGTDAFTQAKTQYALNRVPEAIRLYEIAYRYLPQDDPNWKTAKERLDALRKK